MVYLSFVQQLNRNTDSARHVGVVSRRLMTMMKTWVVREGRGYGCVESWGGRCRRGPRG